MDCPKATEVVNRLIEKKMKITFAESCTGGLAASVLVGVPDASKVFDGSFVTYASEMKTALVNVSAEVIARYGVVSEETARQMAIGCAERLQCEVGVGITGFAGPTGGTAETPVGTVCFGFCINSRVSTYTVHFGNIGRNAVREKSVEFVYNTLSELL